MNVVVLALVSIIVGADAAPAAPADDAASPAEPAWKPVELEPIELPESVDQALGIEGASPLRRAGIASLVTGGLLGVVSASAFGLGFEAERELRAQPHPTAQADGLLLERALAAAVAYPALVLGAAGVAAGITCLIWDDTAGGLSDGNEEVPQ